MARQVLPVIGAAIGAYFGGAQGAQIGWAIGSVVGNAVDPLVVKGPTIGDIANQTSQEGVPRPIIYGVSPPMAGNIVAIGAPIIVTKKHSQGKGGPVTTSQSVYRSYAIGICEGPIDAFIRVWRNGQLVFDARPGGTPVDNDWISAARFHLGTWNQLPAAGLANQNIGGAVPAMRGTAYLEMHEEDLTSLQGAVPQYAFQVMRCHGSYMTSRPYAVEVIEDAIGSGLMVAGGTGQNPIMGENATGTGYLQSGDLEVTTVYGDYDYLETMAGSGYLASGSLPVTTSYGEIDTSENVLGSGYLASGSLPVTVVYVDYTIPAESVKGSGYLHSGALA